MEKELSMSKSAVYMREWISRPGNLERRREMSRRYYKKSKESGKVTKDNIERNRFRKHGTTREDFQKLIDEQGGGCAICGKEGNWLTLLVDHDHSCCDSQFSCGKCIRGALCKGCNTALGLLKESAETIKKALDYMNSSKVRNINGA